MFLPQRQINVIILLVKEQCLWTCRGCAIWLSDAKETVFSHVGRETDQIGNFTLFCPLTPTCLFRVLCGFFRSVLVFFLNVVFLCTPAKRVFVRCCFSLCVVLFSDKTQINRTPSKGETVPPLCPRAAQWVLRRLLSSGSCGIWLDLSSVMAIPFVWDLITC